jgi:hypothetical protein
MVVLILAEVGGNARDPPQQLSEWAKLGGPLGHDLMGTETAVRKPGADGSSRCGHALNGDGCRRA